MAGSRTSDMRRRRRLSLCKRGALSILTSGASSDCRTGRRTLSLVFRCYCVIWLQLLACQGSHMANKHYLCLLALFLTVLGFACAQEPTGRITGTVVDPSGATVPRANVTVEDQRTGRAFSAKTTENGEFTFPALAAGRYQL